MKASLKHKDNEMAVSPIVATLVLVVVAVVGAVAVGTIMGTFSSDVSKQANTDGAGTAAQTEILTAGSTTVQPASEEIAKAYMAKNPGVKITVQGGGSGAGVAAVGSGTVDIGATSDIAKVTDKVNDGTFPNLKTYLLGGSAIVVIQNEGTHAMAAAPAAASYQSDLKNIYDTSATTVSAANITDATVVVYRSDSSGTANEFCKAIGLSGQVTPVANTVAGSTTTVSGAQGNAGVVSKVATTARSIGYADMGYVFDSNGNEVANIDIVPVIEQVGGPAFGSITKSTIKNAVKVRYNNPTVAAGGSTDYPVTLTRSLHYITNGEPSSVVKNYIQFAQSPGATAAINAAGMFANADLV